MTFRFARGDTQMLEKTGDAETTPTLKIFGNPALTTRIILGNPVHTYNVVKRLTVDFASLEAELKRDDWRGE